MEIRIRLFASLLLLAFGATAIVPVAQEAPPPAPGERTQGAEPAAPAEAPTPSERAETPAPPARDEPAAEDDEEWEMPVLPDDLLEDDVFIPSEEIQADEEVTFPVNI